MANLRITILTLALLAACEPDPTPKCEEAYDHLLALAKRPIQVDQKERFMNACKEAFDEKRHSCFLGAKSVDEALLCRPGKVRPG